MPKIHEPEEPALVSISPPIRLSIHSFSDTGHPLGKTLRRAFEIASWLLQSSAEGGLLLVQRSRKCKRAARRLSSPGENSSPGREAKKCSFSSCEASSLPPPLRERLPALPPLRARVSGGAEPRRKTSCWPLPMDFNSTSPPMRRSIHSANRIFEGKSSARQRRMSLSCPVSDRCGGEPAERWEGLISGHLRIQLITASRRASSAGRSSSVGRLANQASLSLPCPAPMSIGGGMPIPPCGIIGGGPMKGPIGGGPGQGPISGGPGQGPIDIC
mmetsp:Transcript_28343/g.71163  ORF Transcript_28343/g.71163 Transcript_28343/m.71163 type:complete len:272 (-) Transcript_28343:671-1486(-)